MPTGIVNEVQMGESSICERVIDAIAEAEETDPTELNPPLYEAIDPDALDTLFGKGGTIGKLIFNYNGYEVSVFPDGYVSVDDDGP